MYILHVYIFITYNIYNTRGTVTSLILLQTLNLYCIAPCSLCGRRIMTMYGTSLEAVVAASCRTHRSSSSNIYGRPRSFWVGRTQ